MEELWASVPSSTNHRSSLSPLLRVPTCISDPSSHSSLTATLWNDTWHLQVLLHRVPSPSLQVVDRSQTTSSPTPMPPFPVHQVGLPLSRQDVSCMGCWEVILNHTCQALKAQEALHAHQLFCLRNNPLLSREMGLTLSYRVVKKIKWDNVCKAWLNQCEFPCLSTHPTFCIPWGPRSLGTVSSLGTVNTSSIVCP